MQMLNAPTVLNYSVSLIPNTADYKSDALQHVLGMDLKMTEPWIHTIVWCCDRKRCQSSMEKL